MARARDLRDRAPGRGLVDAKRRALYRDVVTDSTLVFSVGQSGGAGRATAVVGVRSTAAGGTGGPPGSAAVTDAPLAGAGGEAGWTGRATTAVGCGRLWSDARRLWSAREARPPAAPAARPGARPSLTRRLRSRAARPAGTVARRPRSARGARPPATPAARPGARLSLMPRLRARAARPAGAIARRFRSVGAGCGRRASRLVRGQGRRGMWLVCAVAGARPARAATGAHQRRRGPRLARVAGGTYERVLHLQCFKLRVRYMRGQEVSA